MIGNDWDIILSDTLNSDKFKNFYNNILDLYKKETIYPSKENIFNALKLTPYSDVKVVIVGQDPYHGEGEAHGLSFSVLNGVKLPPTLKNIHKELSDDLGIVNTTGDFTKWAKDGVLLLNSILTVKKDQPLSFKDMGWEELTDEIITKLNSREKPIVFILWGKFAESKASLITNKKHLILVSAHPSPFSARRGFFGSKPFSKTNEFLKKNGIKEVDWKL